MGFFFTIFYQPMYNLITELLFLSSGIIYIAFFLLAVIIKIVLFPLAAKAIKSQYIQQSISKDLMSIKEKNKKDPKKQAEEIMSLYKEKNINPFTGLIVLILQIPIIVSASLIILRDDLNPIVIESVYSFVRIPEMINNTFWIWDLSEKNISLPIIVLILNTILIYLTINVPKPKMDEKTEMMRKVTEKSPTNSATTPYRNYFTFLHIRCCSLLGFDCSCINTTRSSIL